MSELSTSDCLDPTTRKKIGLGNARYRIFLCMGPDCSCLEDKKAAWKHLKIAIKNKGLHKGEGRVIASKTSCMRVCGDGPIVIVYPDRVWYRRMDAQGIDRVIEEHLIGGEPVKDLMFDPPDDVREPV